MSKLCKFFGYDLEQGVKAFCLVELVLAYVHCLISLCVVRLAVAKYIHHGAEYFGVIRWILFLTYELFMISLLLQAVSGVLMYFVGYRRKKLYIFMLWMVVAAFNIFCPVLIMIMAIIGDEESAKDLAGNYVTKQSVLFMFLYLLYIIFGLLTIGPYTRHLRALRKEAKAAKTMEALEAGATSTAEEMPETGEPSHATISSPLLYQVVNKENDSSPN